MVKLPGFIIRAGVGLKDIAPDLMVWGGIAALVGGGIAIYHETTTLPDILDEQEEKLNEIIEQYDEEELQVPAVRREIRKVKVETFGRVAWHYAPAAGLTALGITLELTGHGIIKKRYLAAVAGYNALQKAYDVVMDRALEKYGEEGVKWLKYGTRYEEVEDEIIEEDGTVTKVKSKVEIAEGSLPSGSVYSIMFGPGDNVYDDCQGDPLYIRNQLEVYQAGLNEKYNAGYPVYYDDIVVAFCGVDSPRRVDELRNTGWYKRDRDNKEAGDNCIDLNISTVVSCDPDTGDDTVFVRIDPNVPGIVSLNAGKNRIRKFGGKYLSQI